VTVAGPNQVPVPSEHPNNDLLADLAAEVLPDDLAGHVQDHVIGCSLCAALLADAEGVRSMLLQVEPEQMPAEVLTRLEQALLTARREDEAARAAGVAGDSGETRIMSRLPLGTDSGRTDPGRRIARSPATGRIGAVGPATAPLATGGPKTGRLSRMSSTRQGARRQAIEEQKADRPSPIARLTPVLRIAAAVLVVVGVGALTLQLRGGDSSGGAADSSAAGTVAGGPVITPVQSTATDYVKKALPAQVKTLISNSQKLLASPNALQDEASGVTANRAQAPEAAKSAPGPTPAAGAQGQLLRSPAALQACLAAIGANQVQPVAVDLARYAGREAAIIVLPADGGGYDVWVVARDCRAGSDGAIAVINNVKP